MTWLRDAIALLALACLSSPVIALSEGAQESPFPSGSSDGEVIVGWFHFDSGNLTAADVTDCLTTADRGPLTPCTSNPEQTGYPLVHHRTITRLICALGDITGVDAGDSFRLGLFYQGPEASAPFPALTGFDSSYSDSIDWAAIQEDVPFEIPVPHTIMPASSMIQIKLLALSAASDDNTTRGPCALMAKRSGGKPHRNLMILADSIGRGTNGPAGCSGDCVGYRKKLMDSLLLAGLPFNMVGPRDEGDFYDSEHNGTSSKRCDEFHDEASDISTYRVDVLGVACGPNDISAGDTAAQVAADIEQIVINALAEPSPPELILVQALLVLSNPAFEATRLEVNGLLETMAAAYPNVVFMPEFGPMLTVADLSDGVHPNDSTGYPKLADGWLVRLAGI